MPRTSPGDRAESWKIPNYNLVDFHATYDLPIDLGGVKLQVFAHIFNLLDEEYVQEALDNSQYNSYQVDGEIVNPHKADAAEVFFGLPRQINAGLSVLF